MSHCVWHDSKRHRKSRTRLWPLPKWVWSGGWLAEEKPRGETLPTSRQAKRQRGSNYVLEAKTFGPPDVWLFLDSQENAQQYSQSQSVVYIMDGWIWIAHITGRRRLRLIDEPLRLPWLIRVSAADAAGSPRALKFGFPSLLVHNEQSFSTAHFNFPVISWACPPTKTPWAVPSSRPHPRRRNGSESVPEAGEPERRSCCANSRASRPATAASSKSRSGRRASTRMCWSGSWMPTFPSRGVPRSTRSVWDPTLEVWITCCPQQRKEV